MIRVFNSSVEGERLIPLDEVNIVSHKIDYNGSPYIMFDHSDYPLGVLKAVYDGSMWLCDLD